MLHDAQIGLLSTARAPEENKVMSTVLVSKAFLKTTQVIADRSWQDIWPSW